MKQKGFILTMDSVISIMVAILFSMTIYDIQIGQHTTGDVASIENLHYVSENILETMNKRGDLDKLGCCWATNDNSSKCGFDCIEAKSRIEDYICSGISRSRGYNLTIEDDMVLQRGTQKPPLTHSSRLVSGFTMSKITEGWVAHAYEINGTAPLKYVPYGNVSFDSPEDAVDDALNRLDDIGGNVSLAKYKAVGGVKSLWGPVIVRLIVWVD